jgi:hypothetical protein
MTSEEVDQMKAGPELDTLVSIAVMEWTPLTDEQWAFYCMIEGQMRGIKDANHGWHMSERATRHLKNPDGWLRPPDRFSTEMGFAWEVVEKMREKFGSVRIEEGDGNMWLCRIATENPPRSSYWHELVEESAHAAPLAICRAALKAMLDS